MSHHPTSVFESVPSPTPIGQGPVIPLVLVAACTPGQSSSTSKGGTVHVLGTAPTTGAVAGPANSLGQGYQLLTAAAFFSMIVPLEVFFSLQRFFVRGILAGSVKG
jgi:hypothetical protein